VAFPLAAELAKHNEVWGIARFADRATRDRVESVGVATRVVDLTVGDFAGLPDDFTYLLHLAAYLGDSEDFDFAIAANAEGTGLVMQHCRKAKAALIMTTSSVYRPHEDPWFAYKEMDPLGDGRLPIVPTYSISKIAQEAVARTYARTLDLPTVITRINCPYGFNGGMVVNYLDAIVAGRPVTLRWDPNPYSPIHESDVFNHLPALLDVASVPATIVNWGNDEPVAMQDLCRFIGDMTARPVDLRVTEVPGTHRGAVADPAKRLAITGPTKVSWQEGMRRVYSHRYPDGTVLQL
jgi:nucleoside-diphosphate-sugar epimerase